MGKLRRAMQHHAQLAITHDRAVDNRLRDSARTVAYRLSRSRQSVLDDGRKIL